MAKEAKKFQCSACRTRKEIVVRASGMNYCEECKHKAPEKGEFDKFVRANVPDFIDIKKREKFSVRINF